MAKVVELVPTGDLSSSAFEKEKAVAGDNRSVCRPERTLPVWRPSTFGEESWAHFWMQRAHVAAMQGCISVHPSLGFGSAGVVQSSASSGLLQLEQFPCSGSAEGLHYSCNASRGVEVLSDYNFVKNININKVIIGPSSSHISRVYCNDSLSAPSLGLKGSDPLSNVSTIIGNANANFVQQTESRFSASNLDSPSREEFHSVSNFSCALTESKKTFAEVVVPKVVSESIPLVGCTPECGIIMQKVAFTFLDDYARAIMDVIGPKSIAFLGKAPGMQDYMMAFLVSPKLVTKIVENGVMVKGVWICVTRVQEPATKVIVSDVLPYIADSEILGACKSFAKPVFDKLRRIPAAVRGSRFSGILSFRREIQLILNKDATLPDSISVFSNGQLHILQLSAVGIKCYRCSAVGHVAARCKASLASLSRNNGRAGKEGVVNSPKEHLKAPPASSSLPLLVPQVGGVSPPGVSAKILQDKPLVGVQKLGPKPPSPSAVNKTVGLSKAVINVKKSSSPDEVHPNSPGLGHVPSLEKSDIPAPPTAKRPPSDIDAKSKKISKNCVAALKCGSPRSAVPVDPPVFCFKSPSLLVIDEGGGGVRQKKAKMSSVLCPDQPCSGAKGKRQIVSGQKDRVPKIIVPEVHSTLAIQGSQLESSPPTSQGHVSGTDNGRHLDGQPVCIPSSHNRRRKTAVKIGADGVQDMELGASGAERSVTPNLEISSSKDSSSEKKKRVLVVKKSKPQILNQIQCGEICQSLLDEVFGLKIARRRMVLSNYLARYPDLNSIIEAGMVGMLSA